MKKQIISLLVVLTLALTGCLSGANPFGSQRGNTFGIQKMLNKQETFVFNSLPKTVGELKAMPEAALTTPHMTAALTVAALCAYGENPTASINMLNVLRGPQPLSARTIQLMRDTLRNKAYKPFSYLEGATPQNGYAPNTPYTITVSEQGTSYSNAEPDYAKLFIQSGGADIARPVTLRLKPSTGQWFLTEFSSLLLDMRTPDSMNPWR